MGLSHQDAKLLSYGDVVLRRSDLVILRGPFYINDRIIEFYFTYLSNLYPSSDVLLVPPSISFLIANCQSLEILRDVVNPLDLPSRKIIVFTINDNEDVTLADGGTHWSLLVYDRKKDVFTHHDSLSLNHTAAVKLFVAVRSLMASFNVPSLARDVVQGPTTKQDNGYDCGLFAMAIANAICQCHGVEANCDWVNWSHAVRETVTSSSVGKLRQEVLLLIEGLMEQKKCTEQGKDC